MSRLMKITLGLLAAIIVIVFTFTAGVMLGSYSSASDDANLAAIEDAWRIITEKYVEKDQIDKEALSQAAIQAMMEMIDDPYSSYLDPKAYQSSIEQLEGKFQGIGAEASIRDGQVVVVAPYAGSPAEKAGLEPGDIILAIDGQSTEGLNLMEVVLKVRGPKGTTVNLTVYRPSAGEELQFSIVRDDIYARSVEHEMISDYAYIYISQFAENTNQELGEVLEEIVNNGARGVILDLRYNPGGLADSVIDVASRFIKQGTIFTVRYSDGREEVYKANRQPETTDLPMVVLVNSHSASASEVLAGALQDYDRAVIAGTVTYGKGSLNILTQIGTDQGIYITVARWLTPNGNMIEGTGIIPDVELSLGYDETIQWAADYLWREYSGQA